MMSISLRICPEIEYNTHTFICNDLNTFLFILWVIKTLSVVPQTTYYWQLKEYRWDRMKAFFLQQGGRQIFFSLFDLLLILGLVLGFFLSYLPSEPILEVKLFGSLIGVIFLAQILENIQKLFTKKWKRPRLTLKAVLIILLTLFLEAALLGLFYYYNEAEFSMGYLALILGLISVLDHDINAFSVLCLNTLTNFQKRRLYKKARQKRLTFPDLKVVGITGSYGKSSVKEYLSQILSHRYNVLKTKKNTNTEIGIAQTIMSSLSSEHEFFVCEMGAYRMGEIRVCCAMAKPQIGIFTGLNEQHVALFGSIDNTFKAKWELIQSLSSEGKAIVNADSDPLLTRLKPFKGEMIKVSVKQGNGPLKKLEVHPDHFTFEYKEQKFSAPLVGAMHAVNVLIAIKTAEELGMSLSDIKNAVKSLKAPEKTMELVEIERGHIIDESYHVNTDGLKAAIHHLETFEGATKILFFPGILELGDDYESIHQALGAHIGRHVDKAFFFDPHFSGPLQKGALSAGLTRSDIHLNSDSSEQIQVLKKILESTDNPVVVLFESRGAEKVMKWLKEYKGK